MGLRFRRSIKLAAGICLNLSGSDVSWSLGPRGVSVTHGKRGTRPPVSRDWFDRFRNWNMLATSGPLSQTTSARNMLPTLQSKLSCHSSMRPSAHIRSYASRGARGVFGTAKELA
jgi:hypothetical protein